MECITNRNNWNHNLKTTDENQTIANIVMSWQLAEMQRMEGTHWVWSRTIGTPTSFCMENYWTAPASWNKTQSFFFYLERTWW